MTTVLLDLEETVIESWDKPDLLLHNIEKIKPLIQKDDTFGIFSWAIWNQFDKDTFNTKLRGPLETVLGIRFSDNLIFSMEDVRQLILEHRKKRLSQEDFFDLFGKEECLLALLRCGHFDDLTVVLVDDKVDHGLIMSNASNQMIIFSNIDEMPSP